MVLKLHTLLFLAGLGHFAQVPSMIVAPRMLGWRDDLAKLKPINHWIFLVIAGGIMLTVLGTGVVVMFSCRHLVDGGPLAVAFTGFLTVFWIYRASIQYFLYWKIWPGGFSGRGSHYALLVLFTYLAAIYTYAFVRNISF